MKGGRQLFFLFSEDCAEMEEPLDEELMKQRFDETVDFLAQVVSKITLSRAAGGRRSTAPR